MFINYLKFTLGLALRVFKKVFCVSLTDIQLKSALQRYALF